MTTGHARVFIAVDLPDSVKSEVGKVIAQIDSLEVQGARTARSQGLHLTLRFLGDVELDKIPGIKSSMDAAAAESEPFDLALAGAGAFPNKANPRTLWVGVRGDLERLKTLKSDLDRALETADFPRSRERFTPHVTIARLRDRVPPRERQRVMETLNASLTSPLNLRVDSITLMQTAFHPSGSVYSPIHISPLAPSGKLQSTSVPLSPH